MVKVCARHLKSPRSGVLWCERKRQDVMEKAIHPGRDREKRGVPLPTARGAFRSLWRLPKSQAPMSQPDWTPRREDRVS